MEVPHHKHHTKKTQKNKQKRSKRKTFVSCFLVTIISKTTINPGPHVYPACHWTTKCTKVTFSWVVTAQHAGLSDSESCSSLLWLIRMNNAWSRQIQKRTNLIDSILCESVEGTKSLIFKKAVHNLRFCFLRLIFCLHLLY